MLRALAEAARVLDRDDYRAAAERNAEFVMVDMRRGDKLLRSWKDGQARLDGLPRRLRGLRRRPARALRGDF